MFITYLSYTQCVIDVPADTYTVRVSLTIDSVLVKNVNNSGYNYDLYISYNTSIIGAGASSAILYTLQGSVSCDDGYAFFDLPNSVGSGTIITSRGSIWRANNDWLTATPAKLGCTSIVIEIHSNELPTKFIPCEISLPINLIYFNLSKIKENVLIEWVTASELNNDYFLIQKSNDDIHFNNLDTIFSNGNSNNILHYQFVDTNIYNTINYYRIKQVDKDGSFTYSSIKRIEQKNEEKLFKYSQKLKILTIFGENIEYFIFDIRGRKISEGITTNSKTNINMEFNPFGVYFIKIINVNNNYFLSQKILIE